MGLLTFALSGWLGFLLLYRPDLVPAAPGQALTPAFAGLFAMPWLLMNLVSRTRTPPQQAPATLRTKVRAREVLHGLFAGVMGGAFAALIPAVSGGIGGMLAGHATTLRDDRAFLISQGASKTVYYAGALLLWFVPGLHLSRGGGTALLRGIHDAPPGSYGFVVATIALSAAAALLSLPLFSRAVIGIINRFGLHSISWFAVAMILLVVGAIAGPRGWLVMGTATGIGLIPALSGARRMNALGIILLPLACNMSGVGPAVARFLGVL
jgi:putative membrane protein